MCVNTIKEKNEKISTEFGVVDSWSWGKEVRGTEGALNVL